MLTGLRNCSSGLLRQAKGLMTGSKEVEGGSVGSLCFCKKESGKVW